MKPTPLILVGLLAASLHSLTAAPDLNWPEYRGPRGDGTTTSSLPLTWSETSNVKWKTAIPGKAWSSPVIWGDQIWLTNAPDDGKERHVICVDKNTGRIVRDRKLFDIPDPQYADKFNSHASPTPAIEAGRVYVSFGVAGTACLDSQTGETVWERRDLIVNHHRGAGSSPILWQDFLFLNFDGIDRQFVVALDKRTGRTLWQRDRSLKFRDAGPDGQPLRGGDQRKAFATCQVVTLGGAPTLLSLGASALYAYEPRTGAELWRVEEHTSHSAGTRPIVGHGLIYTTTGWARGQTLAIRPGARGETLDVNLDPLPTGMQLALAWKSKRGTPRKPGLALAGDRLFGIEDDSGVATCWNALTGEVIWNERLGGNFTASPLVAGDRLYCFNEAGKCTVVPTTGPFAKLAENTLDAGCLASPAVSGNALFVRTKTHLYRIEE